jgi:hypothetical protein
MALFTTALYGLCGGVFWSGEYMVLSTLPAVSSGVRGPGAHASCTTHQLRLMHFTFAWDMKWCLAANSGRSWSWGSDGGRPSQ